jgi:hypothetical protein
MTMKMFRIPAYGIKSKLIFLLFVFSFTTLTAQEPSEDPAVKKWNFLAELYLMFPNIQGNVGIGSQLTAPVDATPGDVFSHLQFGGMAYFEAKTDKWAISTDYVLMMLEQDISETELIKSGTVEFTQSIWEVGGLYRIYKFIEVGVGGRLIYLPVSSEIVRNLFPIGSEKLTGSHSKTFFDPIIIARVSTTIKDKWLLQARGDVGGFGVGSDFTWQVQGSVGYRFTKVFQMSLGYRILGIDYDKGEYQERFIFDVNEFGPEVRLGFNF